MTSSKKVKAIYAELRAALGSEISMREAMETAAMLVDLSYQDPDADVSAYDAPIRTQMAVDTSFSDGGWRNLNREKCWSQDNHRPSGDHELRRNLKTFGLRIAA